MLSLAGKCTKAELTPVTAFTHRHTAQAVSETCAQCRYSQRTGKTRQETLCTAVFCLFKSHMALLVHRWSSHWHAWRFRLVINVCRARIQHGLHSALQLVGLPLPLLSCVLGFLATDDRLDSLRAAHLICKSLYQAGDACVHSHAGQMSHGCMAMSNREVGAANVRRDPNCLDTIVFLEVQPVYDGKAGPITQLTFLDLAGGPS